MREAETEGEGDSGAVTQATAEFRPEEALMWEITRALPAWLRVSPGSALASSQ